MAHTNAGLSYGVLHRECSGRSALELPDPSCGVAGRRPGWERQNVSAARTGGPCRARHSGD